MGTALDVDSLACNIGSFLRGKEYDGGGYLLGLAGPSHGDGVNYRLGLFGGHALPDIGVDQSRVYAVGGDSV